MDGISAYSKYMTKEQALKIGLEEANNVSVKYSRFWSTRHFQEDLKQECILALLLFIDKCDLNRSEQEFRVYCWDYMKTRVREFTRRNTLIISLSSPMWSLYIRVKKFPINTSSEDILSILKKELTWKSNSKLSVTLDKIEEVRNWNLTDEEITNESVEKSDINLSFLSQMEEIITSQIDSLNIDKIKQRLGFRDIVPEIMCQRAIKHLTVLDALRTTNNEGLLILDGNR